MPLTTNRNRIHSTSGLLDDQLKSILGGKRSQWKAYLAASANKEVVLDQLYAHIKTFNFSEPSNQIVNLLNFIKELIKLKPEELIVLKKLDKICQEIHRRIIPQVTLKEHQINNVIAYLKFLSTLMRVNYRYLLNKNEITIGSENLQDLSIIRPITPSILSHFRKALKLSFHNTRFLNDYPKLLNAVLNLSVSVEKESRDAELILSAMKLFEILGYLEHLLKISIRNLGISYHLPSAIAAVSNTMKALYDLFRSTIDENFLKYVVYKLYLQVSNKGSSSIELSELCRSQHYTGQCTLDYQHFREKYVCFPSMQPSFNIIIQHNNVSKIKLDEACYVMQRTEYFINWVKALGFEPSYTGSRYLFRVSKSLPDYLIDTFLFERHEFSDESYSGYYFSKKVQSSYLSGIAYSFYVAPYVAAHEYQHHLYNLIVKDIDLDLTYAEGIADLFAAGICNPIRIHSAYNSVVNDTTMLELLKKRKFSSYSHAFKWIAYLVNKQFSFFKKNLVSLREGNKDKFYSELTYFINNVTNVQDFLTWTQWHTEICDQYINTDPDFSGKLIIYLEDITSVLETRSREHPIVKRRERSQFSSDIAIPFFSSPHEVRTNYSLHLNSSAQPFFLVTEKTLSNGTELARYEPKASKGVEIIISLPVSSFFSGVLSAGFDSFGKFNKEKYPYLPHLITYGLKPLFFPLTNTMIDSMVFGQIVGLKSDIGSFISYFVMNYFGFIIHQSINQRVAEKIYNKCIVFLVQVLTGMLLWNPGLFTSEGFMITIIPCIFMSLIHGILFKAGEQGTCVAIDYIGSHYKARTNTCCFFSSIAFNPNTQNVETSKAHKDRHIEMGSLMSPRH